MYKKLSLSLLLWALFTSPALFGQQAPIDRLWKNALKAAEDGLPQTAFDTAGRLLDEAIKVQNQSEIIRASLFQFGQMASWEEDHLIKAIGMAEGRLALLSRPSGELMHSLLAEMYWFYYQQHRYEILERTRAEIPTPSDIKNWDATHFRNSISWHYEQSLQAQAAMDTIPLIKWKSILETFDDEALALQPTLFDFVASRALTYYEGDEAGLTELRQEKPQLPAEVWSTAAEFVSLGLPAPGDSGLRQLRILQQLLLSNLRNDHIEALVYNDLKRFNILRAYAAGQENCDSLYLAGLSKLQQSISNHPASTIVSANIAAYYNQQTEKMAQNKALALEICSGAIAAFPDSRGAKQCSMLRDEIQRKELSVMVERVLLPGKPIPLRLSYRNVTSPSLRIIPLNSSQLKSLMALNDEKDRITQMLLLQPLLDKKLQLPFEPDYQPHATITDLPPLPAGIYVLLISDRDQFTPGGIVAFSSFQVSDLAFISQKQNSENVFYVLHRSSGKAVAKASVRVLQQQYDYRTQQYNTLQMNLLQTDAKGFFKLGTAEKGLPYQSVFIEVSHQGDTLFSDNHFDVYKQVSTDREQQRTWFFTDRSIYRPGQTVHFKGISLKRKGNAPWELVVGSGTTVTLTDANGKEVAKTELTTNAHGSFAGSFVIPQQLLAGSWRLGNNSGMSMIEVAAYKRPSFEVKLQTVSQQFRLNETIQVEGLATALAGYALDSVAVSYTVTRSTVMPWRSYGWMPGPPQDELVVASGTTKTNRQGKIGIAFDAIAGPDKNQAVSHYIFNVQVSVTDRNGETQSSSLEVSVGEKALWFETNLPQTLEISALKTQQLRLFNLQNQAVNAEVRIRFKQLKARERLLRAPIWDSVDRQFIPTSKLNQLFPHDDFGAPRSPSERSSTTIWEGSKLILGSTALFPAEANSWPPGEYELELSAKDAFGKEVTWKQSFVLFNKTKKQLPVRSLSWFHLSKQTAQPGDTVYFYVGSAETGNRVLIEVKSSAVLYEQRWITLSNKLKVVPFVITEAHRGKLLFEAVFIRHNSIQHASLQLDVPFDNQKLDINLLTHRDKLQPGSTETWSLMVKDFRGKGKKAEVLAAMYDASLDAFMPHQWIFDVMPQPFAARSWMTDNGFGLIYSTLLSTYPYKDYQWSWPQTPVINWYGLLQHRYNGRYPHPMMAKSSQEHMDEALHLEDVVSAEPQNGASSAATGQVEPAYLRSDFRETAFFYPQLLTDSTGILKFDFKLPDALTRWKMLLLAHNDSLQNGIQTFEFTASRALMVVPNLPRFFREGDSAFIAAKIVNTSEETLSGIARLAISDALTGKPMMQNSTRDKAFLKLESGQSTVVRWAVSIDDAARLLAVKTTVTAGIHTDSEENYVPILPKGVTVTNAQSIVIPATSETSIQLTGLSPTDSIEKNQLLRIDITSNPAWYAVKALPWLAEEGHENSDRLFYRFYANSLAAHIAARIPQAMTVISQWQNQQPRALLSQLQKDENLKAVLLSETPWVFEAADETQQQQQIALLFDLNRMQYEQEQMLQKLASQQLPDGSWGWFPGMAGSPWVSMQILTGMGRLQQLEALSTQHEMASQMLSKGMQYLELEVLRDYRRLVENKNPDQYQISSFHLEWLYAQSLLNWKSAGDEAAAMHAFLLRHAESDWKKSSIRDQALTALVLWRHGKKDQALRVLASLREKSLYDSQQGRWWKTELHGGGGHQLIETQALLIEAFALSGAGEDWLNGMRQWLLTHKQTNRWETGKATAEAVYALLLQGTDWLGETKAITVRAGGKLLSASDQEAGTGQFSLQWTGSDIQPGLSPLTINNPAKQVAWGSIYRQFTAPVDRVQASNGQLKLEQQLFFEKAGKLTPVTENGIRPGERVRVRLWITCDRDMEFLHLKAYHAAAFEPAETISGFRASATTGYYQSTGDATTDFFFQSLSKGKHLVEYTLIATREGNFAHGYAQVQSFYAPAFSAHTEGLRIVVRE